MKTTTTLLLILFSLSLPAQSPACWGIDDTPILTTEDRIALRLYPAEKPLPWYSFHGYKFKGGGKRAVWISYAVAGVLHGGREAYHAQPTVFETRFGVGKTSFFGSEQWKRQYYSRNPDLPHRPNIWNPLRDYWHFAGASKNYILVGGSMVIGVSGQPLKFKLLDALIGIVSFSASASITYNLLR